VREQVGLGNVRRTKLLGALWKVLDGSLGLENRQRGELGDGDPTTVAGARAPASRQPGQAYTWACKLKWCKRKV
jgi:hypothetical protein